MSRHLVFVYGTLKRGEPNHYLLEDKSMGSSQFVCTAHTFDEWPLIIASKYNIPYLLYEKGFGKRVCGEMYSVDDKMLSKMDELECNPDYYTRIETAVELPDGSKSVPWIYFIVNFKPELLNKETFDDYSSYGSHGLPYVESEQSSSIDDM